MFQLISPLLLAVKMLKFGFFLLNVQINNKTHVFHNFFLRATLRVYCRDTYFYFSNGKTFSPLWYFIIEAIFLWI